MRRVQRRRGRRRDTCLCRPCLGGLLRVWRHRWKAPFSGRILPTQYPTNRVNGLTDPTSGLKALGPRAQTLFALARFPDRYPDADALVLARRARLTIVERPARMRPSRNLRGMHSGLRSAAYAFNMLFSLLVAATGREPDLRG